MFFIVKEDGCLVSVGREGGGAVSVGVRAG